MPSLTTAAHDCAGGTLGTNGEQTARRFRRGTSAFRLRRGLCLQRIASAAERLLRIALDATLQATTVIDCPAAVA
jgi:hypothetical protein